MSVKRAFFSVFQKLTLFCCAMFFGFSNAFSANLPTGYTELEYIQSSGSQYINTGFAPTANYKHTIVFETLSSGTCYLCGTGSAGQRSGNVKLTGNNILDIYNNDSGTGSAAILGNVQLAQGKNTLVLDLRNASKSYVSLNGVNLETTNTKTYITSSLSVTLFSSGGASSLPLRIYESIIEQNGVVIAHFVPAKNSSGVVGMYDTVNNRFYQNAGTGEFIAGPVVPENPIKIATTAYNAARFSQVKTDLNSAVATIREIVTKTINQTAAIASLQADKQTRPEDACPAGKKCLLVEDNNGKPHWYEIIENICGVPSGYTCLEYIQSTGSQYIDTGVVFDSGSLKFETDVYVTANITSEEDFIGNFTGSTLTAGFVGGFAGVTFLYSSSPNINVPRIKQNSWQKYIGEFTNSNQMILTYDGTTVSATRTKQHNTAPIMLFRGSDRYMPAKHIRLGIVSIYLNNTMVRNFVPAKRNSDGAIGMYDLTNLNPATAFYTNSGTGTFTAGPEM